MGFVANVVRFSAAQKVSKSLRFYKVTESLKVMGTFLETQCRFLAFSAHAK